MFIWCLCPWNVLVFLWCYKSFWTSPLFPVCRESLGWCFCCCCCCGYFQSLVGYPWNWVLGCCFCFQIFVVVGKVPMVGSGMPEVPSWCGLIPCLVILAWQILSWPYLLMCYGHCVLLLWSGCCPSVGTDLCVWGFCILWWWECCWDLVQHLEDVQNGKCFFLWWFFYSELDVWVLVVVVLKKLLTVFCLIDDKGVINKPKP